MKRILSGLIALFAVYTSHAQATWHLHITNVGACSYDIGNVWAYYLSSWGLQYGHVIIAPGATADLLMPNNGSSGNVTYWGSALTGSPIVGDQSAWLTLGNAAWPITTVSINVSGTSTGNIGNAGGGVPNTTYTAALTCNTNTTNCITFALTNTSPTCILYGVMSGPCGSPGSSSGTLLYGVPVPAGGYRLETLCATNGTYPSYHVEQFNCYGEPYPIGPCIPPSSSNSTCAGCSAASTAGNNPNGTGTQYTNGTGNVNWGTNTPDPGESAILDAIIKQGNQAHWDASNIVAAIGRNGAGTNVYNISNHVSVTATNINLNSNSVTVNVTNLPGDMSWTNTLTAINSNISLTIHTNMSWGTNDMDLTYTAAAAGAATNDGGFGNLIATLKAGIPSFTAPTGVPGGWDIEIGPRIMHLDPFGPDSPFSDVWSFMYRFTAWILAAGYITKVVVDSFQVVLAMGTAKGSTIQDMEVEGEVATIGGGGNAAGIAAAVLVRIAVMVAYGVCLGLIVTGITTVLTGTYNPFGVFGSNPLTGYGGAATVGIQAIGMVFPWQLALGLITSYVTWRLTMSGACMTYMTVMRRLPGA